MRKPDNGVFVSAVIGPLREIYDFQYTQPFGKTIIADGGGGAAKVRKQKIWIRKPRQPVRAVGVIPKI